MLRGTLLEKIKRRVENNPALSKKERASIAQESGEIFERNQLEFEHRIPELSKQENAGRALFKAHYDIPLLRPDAAMGRTASKGCRDILQKAQAYLSERLIAAAARKEIGKGPGQIPSADVERLFCGHFRKAREKVLRGLFQKLPGMFNLLRMSEDEAVRQFNADFLSALPDDPAFAGKGYMNRLLIAHQAAMLKHQVDASNTLVEILFPKILAAMHPSALLATAAHDTALEIAGGDAMAAQKLAWF
jgi:hypothetical protein